MLASRQPHASHSARGSSTMEQIARCGETNHFNCLSLTDSWLSLSTPTGNQENTILTQPNQTATTVGCQQVRLKCQPIAAYLKQTLKCNTNSVHKCNIWDMTVFIMRYTNSFQSSAIILPVLNTHAGVDDGESLFNTWYMHITSS